MNLCRIRKELTKHNMGRIRGYGEMKKLTLIQSSQLTPS